MRFEAITGGTRVLLEPRLVPGGTTAHFLSGWENILGWFGDRADWPGGLALAQKDVPRVSPVLYYKDVQAASDWLLPVFGLRARDRGQIGGLGSVVLRGSG